MTSLRRATNASMLFHLCLLRCLFCRYVVHHCRRDIVTGHFYLSNLNLNSDHFVAEHSRTMPDLKMLDTKGVKSGFSIST